MKLTDLEPEWVRYEKRIELGDWGAPMLHEVIHHDGVTFADAQGIMFLCPHCSCTQHVTLRDRGASDVQGSHNREGKPSRWGFSGTGFADLTLEPSIDSGCGWHGFVTNGEATP